MKKIEPLRKVIDNGRHANPRRGVAVLMVMLLISVVLGLSYAAVRSQHTTMQIQQNSDRGSSARQAAATGLMVAIKKMHQSDDWEGVDTTLAGSLGDYVSFEVTYTTGDPAYCEPDVIDWSDPDYDDPYYAEPYRVTLLSTGTAVDPDNPECVATYQIEAVVQLIPRALAAEPNDWAKEEPQNWDKMMEYAVFQWKKGKNNTIEVPLHIEGPARFQKKLTLAKGYNWEDVRNKYLEDLYKMMNWGGFPDYRPFSGPVYLPHNEQDSEDTVARLNAMDIEQNDCTPKTTDWSHPRSLCQYKIYPGGKTYDVKYLWHNHPVEPLEPDPENNPLGIYRRGIGNFNLNDNDTIRGTLLTVRWCGDVHVYGDGVKLLPLDLPALEENPDLPIRLPTAVIKGHFTIESGTKGHIEGVLAIFGKFEIKSHQRSDIGDITLPCQIIAKQFVINGRSDPHWNENDEWWEDQYDDFEDGEEEYFPKWLDNLDNYDMNPEPAVQITPDITAAHYHYWKSYCNPIYQPHGDDDGLRWELLRWTENPQ